MIHWCICFRLFTLIICVLTLSPFSSYAQNINTPENFPDPNFRAAVEVFMGVSSGGEFTSAEAAGKTETLDCSNKNIGDLTGVEHFTGISSLNCSSNHIASLNISDNMALTTFLCYSNQLTALDISANTALITLFCAQNSLVALDISANSDLTALYCHNNQLTYLDVSANTALNSLDCGFNQLTDLDVSANTALTSLVCNHNQLTSLDVSANTALVNLMLNNNELTALDVSANMVLASLSCANNQLNILDVSANTALTSLQCYTNYLASLDVSNNTALTDLKCYNNQLITLDVTANTSLTTLFTAQNPLTALDVTANTALTTLYCSGNQFSSLDVSANTALTWLNCESNRLTALDVSANTMLSILQINSNNLSDISSLLSLTHMTQVDVRGNKLDCGDWDQVQTLKDNLGSNFFYAEQQTGNLDLCIVNINTPENFPDANFRTVVEEFMGVSSGEAFTAAEAASKTEILDCSNRSIGDLKGIEFFSGLSGLYCNDNLLTDLDLRANTNLIGLNCSDNLLTTLNVLANTAMHSLDCRGNQLRILNISAIALDNLDCSDNLLTSLDVSACPNLWYLQCNNNQLTSLDVSDKSILEKLYCYENQLITINVSGCTALSEFYCQNNQLTTLIMSSNTALYRMNCSNNHLSTLNISECTNLSELSCSSNKLTELIKVTDGPLYSLDCSSNLLVSLDLSYMNLLMDLDCYDNNLIDLSVLGCDNLYSLRCFNNQLDTLDVSDCSNLHTLDCSHNNITNISSLINLPNIDIVDVSYNLLDCDDCTDILMLLHISGFNFMDQKNSNITDCPEYNINTPTNFPDSNFRLFVEQFMGVSPGERFTAEEASGRIDYFDCSNRNIQNLQGIEFFTGITELNCSGNQLASVNISQNTALIGLNCENNRLSQLDLSLNSNLVTLDCSNNDLGNLNVSTNIELTSLKCFANQLTNLDISTNATLVELECYLNQLTALDVSQNTALVKLHCSNNSITTLDLSLLLNLQDLSCHDNQLTSLDVSNNPLLVYLSCGQNFSLTQLDISHNPQLISLQSPNTPLTVLNLSQNPLLEYLELVSNRITDLDLLQNLQLEMVSINGNLLAEAPNLQNHLNLIFLNITHNNISPESESWSMLQALQDRVGEPIYNELGWLIGGILFEPQNGPNINTVENFPDPLFRAAVEEYMGVQPGGDFTAEQAANRGGSFYYTNRGFTTLQGIHYLSSLNGLDVRQNYLESLDISMLNQLQFIEVSSNSISDLRLPSSATRIFCGNNPLTEIDLNQLSGLQEFVAPNMPIQSVDLTHNFNLEWINLCNNNLYSLDISQNRKLKRVYISANQLTEIANLLDYPDLVAIDISNNKILLDSPTGLMLQELKVKLGEPTYYEWGELKTGALIEPQNVLPPQEPTPTPGPNINTPENFPDPNFRMAVEQFMGVAHEGEFSAAAAAAKTDNFNCSNQNISNLNGIQFFTGITGLDCNNNRLTDLDLSGNTALPELRCNNNSLSNLDVSANTQLINLYCGNNLLTSLDVSSNINLKSIFCEGNQLTALDVSSLPSLEVLGCNDNQLTNLDITGCLALWSLSCYSNRLTSLDLTGLTAIITIYCHYNNLIGLDVTDCAALTHLWCGTNHIDALDLSYNPDLMGLDCGGNDLPTLDISHNPQLMYLNCRDNRLTQLDASHNPRLYSLEGNNNFLTSLNLQIPEITGTLLYSNDFNNPGDANPAQAWPEWIDRTTSGPVAAQNGRIEWTGTGEHFLRLNQSLPVVFSVEFDFFYQSGLVTSGRFSLWPITGDNPWGTEWSHNQYFLRQNTHFFNGADSTPSEGPVDLSLPLGDTPHRIRLEVNNDHMVLLYKNRGQGEYIKIDERDFASYGWGARFLELGFYLDAEPEGLVYIDNLEIRNGAQFQVLKCQNNRLNHLDLSSNSALRFLECHENQLSDLELSHNPELYYVACRYNQIPNLNVTGCSALEILDCQGNPIGTLDVTHNPALRVLFTSNTPLIELDLSQNPALRELYTDNTQFSTLDLSQNPVLHTLFCSGNQLNQIEFSSTASLERIRSERNHLQDSSIFLGLTNLNWLDLRYNDLSVGDWNAIVTLRDRMEAPSFDGGGYLINGFAYSPQNHYDPYDFSTPNINTEENFPDPNFRAFVEDFVGVPHGYGFTAAMASAKTGQMNCSNRNIGNLKGIEFFSGVSTVNASHNQINNLSLWVDTSNLSAGDVVVLSDNPLDEGDLVDVQELQSRSVIVIWDGLPATDMGIFTNTADWQKRGNFKVPGSVQVQGPDTAYVLKGNGDDIWDNADEGFFVYEELEGSHSIQGRVRWIDPGTNDWAKVGFMIRDEAADPGSVQYMAILRGLNDLSNAQWRTQKDQSMNNVDYHNQQNGQVYDHGAGIWFRVTRIAELNYCYSEFSEDGQNWEYGHGLYLPLLGSAAYGLAITNHEDNEQLAVGLAQNVSIQSFSFPVAMRVISPQQLNGGEIVDVTIHVHAAEPGEITVTETPPSNVNVLSVANNGILEGGTITWTLNPTEAGIYTLTYRIQYPLAHSLFSWVGHIGSKVVVGDHYAVSKTALDDYLTTDEDTPVTITVLQNDKDDDGDSLTVTSVNQAGGGTTQLLPDGRVLYTPNLDFHGTDSFQYWVEDGNGETDNAQVHITVNSIVDPKIINVNANINCNMHSWGQTNYNFGMNVETNRDFYDLQLSDIELVINNTGYPISNFNVSPDRSWINLSGQWDSTPPLGEYSISILGDQGQTVSYVVGTLAEYPTQPIEVTIPADCSLITQPLNEVRWNPYNYIYQSTPVSVNGYNVHFNLPNNQGNYQIGSTPGNQNYISYFGHEWWDHRNQQNTQPPTMIPGNYTMQVGASLDVPNSNIDFGVTMDTGFVYGETDPYLSNGFMHVYHDIHFNETGRNDHYGFYLWISLAGQFVELQKENIVLKVLNPDDRTLLAQYALYELNGPYQEQCNHTRWEGPGEFEGNPPAGEYVAVVSVQGVEQEYSMGVFNMTGNSPELLHPTPCEYFTDNNPEFAWTFAGFGEDAEQPISQNRIYISGPVWGESPSFVQDNAILWNELGRMEGDTFIPVAPLSTPGRYGIRLEIHQYIKNNIYFIINAYSNFAYAPTRPCISRANLSLHSFTDEWDSGKNERATCNIGFETLGDVGNLQASDVDLLILDPQSQTLQRSYPFNTLSQSWSQICSENQWGGQVEIPEKALPGEYVVSVRVEDSTLRYSLGVLESVPDIVFTTPTLCQAVTEEKASYTWSDIGFPETDQYPILHGVGMETPLGWFGSHDYIEETSILWTELGRWENGSFVSTPSTLPPGQYKIDVYAFQPNNPRFQLHTSHSVYFVHAPSNPGLFQASLNMQNNKNLNWNGENSIYNFSVDFHSVGLTDSLLAEEIELQILDSNTQSLLARYPLQWINPPDNRGCGQIHWNGYGEFGNTPPIGEYKLVVQGLNYSFGVLTPPTIVSEIIQPTLCSLVTEENPTFIWTFSGLEGSNYPINYGFNLCTPMGCFGLPENRSISSVTWTELGNWGEGGFHTEKPALQPGSYNAGIYANQQIQEGVWYNANLNVSFAYAPTNPYLTNTQLDIHQYDAPWGIFYNFNVNVSGWGNLIPENTSRIALFIDGIEMSSSHHNSNFSLDCQNFTIYISGGYDEIFHTGEYKVVFLDEDDVSQGEYIITDVEEIPNMFPVILNPKPIPYLEESEPIFAWEPYRVSYRGGTKAASRYVIGLTNNNIPYGINDISAQESSLDYHDSRWINFNTGTPEIPPTLMPGVYQIHLGAEVPINQNYTYYANKIIQCLYREPLDLPVGVFDRYADWFLRGSVKAPGSATYEGSSGTYILQGNGDDIWDNSDEGFFLFKELEGSHSIQGRVRWNDHGTNDWAKIGLMIRDEGLAPGSTQYMSILRGLNDLSNAQWRPEKDQPMYNFEYHSDQGEQIYDQGQGVWFRVTRIAELNACYSEFSLDGQNWQAGHGAVIPMTGSAAYGLAITNHEDNLNSASGYAQDVSIQPVSQPAAVRSFSPTRLQGGEIVDVTIAVYAPNSNEITVTEFIPAGWRVASIDNGGQSDNGAIVWKLNPSSGSVTLLNYQVYSPVLPGWHYWNGNVGALSIVGNGSAFYYPQSQAAAPLTNNSVNLDGILSPAEWGSSYSFVFDRVDYNLPGVIVQGNPQPFESSHANVHLQHDDQFLYIAVDVLDDLLDFDSNPDAWANDASELNLDGNFSRSPSKEANQYGFQAIVTGDGAKTHGEVVPTPVSMDGGGHFSTDGIYWNYGAKAKEDGSGYVVEYRIDKSRILSPSNRTLLGFDIAIDDGRGTGNREGKYAWNSTGENGNVFDTWNDESGWGTLRLLPNLLGPAPTTDNRELWVRRNQGLQIQLAGVDPEGESVRYDVVNVPSNGYLYQFDRTAGTLTYYPNFGFTGVDSFTFSVSDDSLNEATAVVSITVYEPNHEPTFLIGEDIAVLEDSGNQTVTGWAQNISPGAPDEEHQALTFVLTSDNPSLFTEAPQVNPYTGDLTFTPAPDANGNAEVTVILLDDGGTEYGGVDTSAQLACTLNVLPVNDAPYFVTEPAVSTLEDQPYSYNIVTGDVDNDVSVLVLTPISLPPWLSYHSTGNGTGLLSGIPNNDHVGSSTVTLRISDEKDYFDRSYSLNVLNVNDAPTFTSVPILTAQEGQLYQYSIIATDPDFYTSALTITAFAKPSWLTLTDNGNGTAILSGIPAANQVGEHSVLLWVQDGFSSSEQSFTLIVSPAPTATSTATPTATPTHTPSPTPTDTPSPTLTFTPTSTPTDTPSPTPSDTPSPTPTDTPSPSPTDTATWTVTPTNTWTATPTATPTVSPTHTPGDSPTPTVTPTHTVTATFSPTPTLTATPSSTATPTPFIVTVSHPSLGYTYAIHTRPIPVIQFVATNGEITSQALFLNSDGTGAVDNKIAQFSLRNKKQVWVRLGDDEGGTYRIYVFLNGGQFVYEVNWTVLDPKASPTPTATSTPSATVTPSASPTATATVTFTQTPSATPTLTPEPTATPTATTTPTETLKPVVWVQDNVLLTADLSNGIDEDFITDQELVVSWTSVLTEVSDYHVYVSIDGTPAVFLGRSGGGDVPFLIWKANSDLLSEVFRNGPQFDHSYRFYLIPLLKNNSDIPGSPFTHLGPVTYSEGFDPTVQVSPIIVTDTVLSSDDLSNQEDTDQESDRELVIRWDFSALRLPDIADYHVFVSIDGAATYEYLGHSGDSDIQYLVWKSGSDLLNEAFRGGPEFGHAFQFEVVVLRHEGRFAPGGPFLNIGPVAYVEGQDTTPHVIPVIVTDSLLTSVDLSGQSDTDPSYDRNLALRWDLSQLDLKDVEDNHVFVFIGDASTPVYLGHTGSGSINHFEWRSGSLLLNPIFRDGPEYNNPYRFEVVCLRSNNKGIVPGGPFTNTGTVTLLQGPETDPANRSVIVRDSLLTVADLSDGTDTDLSFDRVLVVSWALPELPGRERIADYHVFVVTNENGSAQYLGHTGSGLINFLEWRIGSHQLASNFRNGPQFGNTYRFLLTPLLSDGGLLEGMPFTTGPVVYTSGTDHNALTTPVTVTDSLSSTEDLSGKIDLDSAFNRSLVVRWSMNAEPLSDVTDLHIFVYVNESVTPVFLGRTASGTVNYFNWETGNTLAAPTFRDGPKFGDTYRFEVIPLLPGGQPIAGAPFTHAGAVIYQRGVDKGTSLVAVRDSLFTKIDLSNAADTDLSTDRNLVVTWDVSSLSLQNVQDYHVFVVEEENAQPRYLGRSGSGESRYLEWKEGNFLIGEEFRGGPQFGHAYAFLVYPRYLENGQVRNANVLRNCGLVQYVQSSTADAPACAVIVCDDLTETVDLCNRFDTDSTSSRALAIRWDLALIDKSNVTDWHIYVYENGAATAAYLGRTGSATANSLEWKVSPSNLFAAAFRNGPQFGRTYRFELRPVMKKNSPRLPYSPYISAGPVEFREQSGTLRRALPSAQIPDAAHPQPTPTPNLEGRIKVTPTPTVTPTLLGMGHGELLLEGSNGLRNLEQIKVLKP